MQQGKPTTSLENSSCLLDRLLALERSKRAELAYIASLPSKPTKYSRQELERIKKFAKKCLPKT